MSVDNSYSENSPGNITDDNVYHTPGLARNVRISKPSSSIERVLPPPIASISEKKCQDCDGIPGYLYLEMFFAWLSSSLIPFDFQY